jgi:NADH dehydrogenase/NADH:ubiquinone oxidoreductase subunit G
MFILKITKNGITEQSDFATNQEALDHLAIHKGTDEQIIHHEAVLDENGAIATEAHDEIIPANYAYSITEQAEPIADISPRQIRLALLSLGLTELTIDSAIGNLESPTKEQAMIAWKYSTSFKRDVPIIAAIGKLLGLSSEQLDALWIAGKDL